MFSKKCLTLIFQLLLSTGEDFFACQLLVRVPPIEKLCCKTTVTVHVKGSLAQTPGK
jgi:hypothetical protein